MSYWTSGNIDAVEILSILDSYSVGRGIVIVAFYMATLIISFYALMPYASTFMLVLEPLTLNCEEEICPQS